jgi:hypothetical protein
MSSHKIQQIATVRQLETLLLQHQQMNSQLPFLLQQQSLTHKENQRDQEESRRTNKIVSIIGMLVHMVE